MKTRLGMRRAHAAPRGPALRGPALRGVLAVFLATAVPSFASDEDPWPFQLVVHAENQAEPLDPYLVSKLFLRKVRRWEDGTTVQPFDADRDSPLHAAFVQAIHGKSPSTIQSYWQRMVFSGRSVPPEMVASDQEMLERVRSHRGAVGYVSPGRGLGPGVRLLEVVEGGLGGFGSRRRSPSEAPGPRHLPRQRAVGSFGPTAALRSSNVAVAPGRPSVLYASFPGIGLASSQDGGETWMHLGTGPEGQGSEPSASSSATFDQLLTLPDGSALLATEGQRVWRSTDGGGRWRAVAPVPARSLVLDPVEPGIVYAFAPGSLWRSLDGGRSFSRLALPESQGFEILVAAPSWPGLLAARGATIWRGESRGERWQTVSRIPSVGGIRDLAVDPRSADVLFAATTHGVHRSGDRGRSWEPLGLDGEVDSLVATGSSLIAGQGGKVFVLSAGRWRRVPELDGARIAVDPASPDRLYATGPSGRILSSEDGGVSWRRLGDLRRRPLPVVVIREDRPPPPTPRRAPVPAELQLNCGNTTDHVAALAVAPSEPSTVYAAGHTGVHVSRDHGVTWSAASAGLEVMDVHALAVDSEQPALVYAGTHGRGVFRSGDGGVAWRPARRGLDEPLVHSLLIDPFTRSRIYAGTASGLFVSSDHGDSWSPFGPAAPASSAGRTAFLELAVDPRSPECLGAAASGGGLWLAEAPGFRWTRTEGLLSLDPSGVLDDGPRCSGGFLSAHGRPWDSLGIDLRALRARSLLFDPLRADHLFAATVLGIWHSGDGGEHWRRIEIDENVAALAAMGTSGLLAGGLHGLRRSKDGGASWRGSKLREHVYALAVDPVDSATIYAGLGGGRVAVSWDAAESWRVEELPPPPIPTADRPQLVARPAPAAVPEEVGSAALALWHEVWRTPAADLERRALLLAELLPRAPAAFESTVRTSLIEILQQLDAAEIEVPRARLALHLAPGERWMAVSYGTKGCPACADEMRVFDLRALPLRPAEENRGQRYWRALHDPSLEPPHLPPRWVLPDAGHLVAWSGDGGFLVTQQRLARRLTGEEPIARSAAGGAGDMPPLGAGSVQPERPPEHAGARLVVWKVGPEKGAPGDVASGPTGPEVARHREWEVGFEWARCLSRETAKAHSRRRYAPSEHHPETCKVALGGDGEHLAFAGVENGSSSVWLARREGTGVEVDTLWRLPPRSSEDRAPPEARESPPAYWQDLRFTRGARRLLGFSSDGGLWVHRPSRRQPEPPPELPEPIFELGEAWGEIASDPGGRWLAAVGGTTGRLRVWSLARGPGAEPPLELQAAGVLSHLLFSDDGRWLAVDSSGGETSIFDLGGAEAGRAHVTLAHGQRLGVFDAAGEAWKTFGPRTRQRMDLRRGRATWAGSSVHDSPRIPAGWGERIGGGPLRYRVEPEHFSSPGRTWAIEIRGYQIQAWALAAEPTAFLAFQVDRRVTPAPSGPSGSRKLGRIRLPNRPLLRLTTRELRDLACGAAGRSLSREDWRRLIGEEPWRPTCQPRPPASGAGSSG